MKKYFWFMLLSFLVVGCMSLPPTKPNWEWKLRMAQKNTSRYDHLRTEIDRAYAREWRWNMLKKHQEEKNESL